MAVKDSIYTTGFAHYPFPDTIICNKDTTVVCDFFDKEKNWGFGVMLMEDDKLKFLRVTKRTDYEYRINDGTKSFTGKIKSPIVSLLTPSIFHN